MKKKTKIIYYYYRRNPEYGIYSFEVKDELRLKGKNIDVIQYLVANYDIEMIMKDKVERWISVYTPYEDDDIFVHDRSHTIYGSDFILSYNKEKLERWHKDDFNEELKRLEKRLEEFNGQNRNTRN